ncbi:MAG: hypothetical protein ACOYOT_00910 [Bacteroidales bacterium]
MKKKISLLVPVVLALLFAACTKEETLSKTISKQSISGLIQKGPFVNGSSITLYELSDKLAPSGKVFDTQISDNKGSFAFSQVELASPFVKLKADGFYFNEVSGEKSAAQITLYALSDLQDKSTVNVNVITHLERSRVENLVQSGLSFAAAKKQAQREVLSIFNMSIVNDSTSESLNLSAKGANNGILLAVSAILQGRLSTADMVELMANISKDISTDGVLNDKSLGSQLIDNALMINLATVRANLEAKYKAEGLSGIEIPDFETSVNNFIKQTTFVPVKTITYPAAGGFGANILNDTVTVLKAMQFYSMTANLPSGNSLRVNISGGKWYYQAIPAPINWLVSAYKETFKIQTFTVTASNAPNDLSIAFEANDNILIEYYENGATSPSRTKHLKIVTP